MSDPLSQSVYLITSSDQWIRPAHKLLYQTSAPVYGTFK